MSDNLQYEMISGYFGSQINYTLPFISSGFLTENFVYKNETGDLSETWKQKLVSSGKVLIDKIDILTNQTGQYYTNDNPSNFVTINQAQNGTNTINNRIDSLSGYVINNSISDKPTPLQFVSTAVIWTNMPLAPTFFAGSIGYTQYMDLTNFTGVQLCITKAATAGGPTSMLQLKYNGNFNSTVGNYLNLDTNNTRSFINVQNTYISSGYQPIVNAARSGVFVTLIGSGGDGVLDPQIGSTIAYFK